MKLQTLKIIIKIIKFLKMLLIQKIKILLIIIKPNFQKKKNIIQI